jgi:exopolysaccharide biosynthesis polyprenyl glycosylphosphotransferase
MTTFRRRLLIETAKAFDLAAMIFSFGLATVMVAYETPTVSLTQFLSMRIKLGNFALFACFLIVWHIVFSGFGLYGSRRLSMRSEELLDTLKATSVASAILFIAAISLRIGMITPQFVMLFWMGSTAVTLSSRVFIRFVLAKVRNRGRNIRHLLIVGTNCRAMRFAQRIQARPELGYRLIGFVDDEWFGLGEFQKSGHTLVSDLESLPLFLRDRVVDEVIVALPMESSYRQAAHAAAVCEEQGILVRLLGDIFNLRLARSRAAEFEGEAVITLYTGSPDGWQHLLKRMLDIALSLVTMTLLAPLGALTALLIKLTSPGPVFFGQERVGLNKRRFWLYKFRTMVPDAEEQQCEVEHLNEVSGPVFKITADPRVTSFGKFLRRASIDELPQLFNVLKGDMSLVGPRPLPVRDYNGFDQDWQRRRFSVRPGITCLWQVNGRSSISFDKWMELDMQYIDHWSLGLDLKILAKTIPAVLKGAGAA